MNLLLVDLFILLKLFVVFHLFVGAVAQTLVAGGGGHALSFDKRNSDLISSHPLQGRCAGFAYLFFKVQQQPFANLWKTNTKQKNQQNGKGKEGNVLVTNNLRFKFL